MERCAIGVFWIAWLLLPVLLIVALFRVAFILKTIYVCGDEPRQRGFEVKPITGSTRSTELRRSSVPEKKDNDHG